MDAGTYRRGLAVGGGFPERIPAILRRVGGPDAMTPEEPILLW